MPPTAIRDNSVFMMLQDRAVRRRVKSGPAGAQGVRIEEGLIGGEDIVINPPANLKDGDRVRQKA